MHVIFKTIVLLRNQVHFNPIFLIATDIRDFANVVS